MESIQHTPSKSILKEEYDKLFPMLKRLCEEVVFILDDEIKKEKIKINAITPRVKKFQSYYNKIVRKEITTHHLEKISDLAGVRVVCLYRSDLDIIGKLITKNFQVVSRDTARIRTEDKFGYMADHYIVKLDPKLTGKRYDELKTIQCEIQVRTVLMDAWAMVSHHLEYKKETDIPSNLKKDFNAVSGLLYAADTHFELFKEGIKEIQTKLLKSVRSDKFNLKQEMNLDSIRAYLRWKMPNRERYSVSTYSDLVSDLRKVGYTHIKDVEEGIQKTEKVAKALEKEEMRKEFYSDTGFARICIMLYDEHFYNSLKKRYFKRNEEFFKMVERYRSTLKNQL